MSVSSLLLVTVTSEVTRIGRAKCIAMVGARDQFPIPLHYIIYDVTLYTVFLRGYWRLDTLLLLYS